jgi:hypothetical protein
LTVYNNVPNTPLYFYYNLGKYLNTMSIVSDTAYDFLMIADIQYNRSSSKSINYGLVKYSSKGFIFSSITGKNYYMK